VLGDHRLLGVGMALGHGAEFGKAGLEGGRHLRVEMASGLGQIMSRATSKANGGL
jgi:hypothetical protein